MPRQDSKTRILDQIRQVLRLHRYSIHTERATSTGLSAILPSIA